MDEVGENLGAFRQAYLNVSLPTTTCLPSFHKMNMHLNDLKRWVYGV